LSDAPVTLFIPFGEGYGKPGITLRAETLKELDAQLSELNESTVADDGNETSLLSEIVNKVKTVDAGVKLVFPQEAKPQRNSSAAVPHVPAASAAHTCEHGAMKYKEGTNAKGPWKGYFCPQPYGSPQCKPQFIK
jgi:hypothetical protein